MRVLSVALVALSAALSCDAFTPTGTFTKTTSTQLQMASNPSQSVFLSPETAKACVDSAGSPVYAYSLNKLEEAADDCLAFPNKYGLTVRYAMKACPNSAILQFFHKKGTVSYTHLTLPTKA